MTDVNAALALITESQQLLDRAKAKLASPAAVTLVKAGESLQAALDKGGSLELEAGVQWIGTYRLSSNTVLTGRAGAKMRGLTGPAIVVPPGTHGVTLADLELSAAHPEVCTIGENSDKQRTAADAPTDVTLSRLRVPTHRGKRAFAIHGAASLLACEVLDCYDPAIRDSQAVYVGNTPGPITITGGRYSAGSEIILFGGDVTWIPNVTPTGILVEGAELFRPLEWKGDGIDRKVKNILELKNARQVVIRNNHLHGCWFAGYQQGEAFVFTPALDGDVVNPPLRSGTVRDVLVEDCNVHDVSSAFNIMGRAYSAFTPEALTNLIVRRLTFVGSAAKYGGRGQLALITGEPGAITFEDSPTVTDGSSLILYDPGNVIDPITMQKRKGGKIGSLTLTGNRANLGEFGLMLGGNPLARHWQDSVETLKVEKNTFGGGPLPDFPNNTYVTPFAA